MIFFNFLGVLAALVFMGSSSGYAEEAVTPVEKPYTEPYIGDMWTYPAKYEDTMVKIARDNDLGFIELRAANPDIDPWLPGEGTPLVMPARHLLPVAVHKGIVINLPEMRLFYYGEKGKPPVTHPIGVGRVGLATPTGKTRVVRKKEGPSWRPTERMREENPELPDVVGPGPENPLGTHALYLGWPEYAIHGTDKPFGIGRRVSSGCIRLYPEDIAAFFPIVPVDTPVTVVDQPVKAAWIGHAFYIEAHPSLGQADKIEQEGGLPTYEMTDNDMRLIIQVAGNRAEYLDWSIIRKVIRERRGYPIIVAQQPSDESTAQTIENDKAAMDVQKPS